MKYKYLVSFNRTRNKPHFRRPIVDVVIFGPKGNVPTIALLDSGADYCLFNIEFAKQIGVDLKKCEKGQTIGVEGGKIDIYMTEVEIQIQHLQKIIVPVGFIDSPSVTGLLGQVGFFDKNRIKFERDHDTFEINQITNASSNLNRNTP